MLRPVKTLTTEAEVDSSGWLNIHTPAPRGMAPGRIEVLVVLPPPVRPATSTPRAGTLPGKVVLAPDFHAPLEDFRPYSE